MQIYDIILLKSKFNSMNFQDKNLVVHWSPKQTLSRQWCDRLELNVHRVLKYFLFYFHFQDFLRLLKNLENHYQRSIVNLISVIFVLAFNFQQFLLSQNFNQTWMKIVKKLRLTQVEWYGTIYGPLSGCSITDCILT